MQALEGVIGTLRQQNREIARVLLGAMDLFAEHPQPSQLQVLLDVLRDGQQSCEDEISRLRAIGTRRKGRYRCFGRRGAEYGRAISAQYDLASERLRLVEVRRRALRQFADTLAWILLGHNPRLIAPLFAPQTHRISRDSGLAGLLLVEHALHESGRYLVLETDLTRCVGTGDLLVVPVDEIGAEPLVLELKSSGELMIGAEIGVGIATAHANEPRHQRIFEEVASILQTTEWQNPRESPRTRRQMEELQERTERMFRTNRSDAQVLRAPRSPHWRAIADVIERALNTGSAFDSVEAGVFKWAATNRLGDDLEAAVLGVHRQIHDLAGISVTNQYATSSTVDLLSREDLSAVVPPVPLWRLPASHRVAILTEELVVGNVRRAGLLNDHLRAHGIEIERVGGGIRLRRGAVERVMTPLEFLRLDASTSLAAVSPLDAASAIAEGFLSHEER